MWAAFSASLASLLMYQDSFLFVNQVVGPLFLDVIKAAEKRMPFKLFQGVLYRRAPAYMRIATWACFSVQLAWHLLLRGRSYKSLLIVSNPPFAPLLAPLAGRPYSLLLYDLYPHVLKQLGWPQLFLAPIMFIWHSLNRYIFSRAQFVFTISDSMALELLPYFATPGLWEKKVIVVSPWASASDLLVNSSATYDFRNEFGISGILLTYSGNLGVTHPLEHLLEFAYLSEKLFPSVEVHVMIIGRGSKRNALEKIAGDLHLSRCRLHFLDPLPYSKLGSALAASDLAVVAIDGPSANFSLPSKAFTAMACGKPLLAIAPKESALAKLVNCYDCGFVVEPNPRAPAVIAEIVARVSESPALLRQLSANSLLASRNYTQSNADRLIDVLLSAN